mmetsp:Transcript_32286/g.68292  ORF Transcript_32286/g.68292 Transcript_32286/m.68292 type:complete len:502 (+) Transcript_32286:95-1600(+)|eukprot:CAMPEP_0183742450 /NCGR_PEP_ID=MMETSP0737-20130205/64704_1 /TAXON_ID=385413 /ORGANISM="Thalassiosira miniscula, Strain CCMP1093" /LENGTH=501 /DNA_ID=CAMNT_0025978037 /DNA_START=53 /DNA_END=1558 /DNA_ORIENTATION=+
MATALLALFVVGVGTKRSASRCHDVSSVSCPPSMRMRNVGAPHIFSKVNSLHAHTTLIADTDNNIVKPSFTTPTPSAVTPIAETNPSYNLHLLSLPYPSKSGYDDIGDDQKPREESILQKCWSWKDVALGDGADHLVPIPRRRQRRRRRDRIEFIPRSAAIRQFQLLFVAMEISIVRDEARARVILNTPFLKKEQNDFEIEMLSNFFDSSSECHHFEEKFVVEECSVLSTCARLDVILVIRPISPTALNDSTTNSGLHTQRNEEKNMAEQLALRYAVAFTLLQQIQSSQKSTKDQRNQILQIADGLVQIHGAHSISTHLCSVAIGLAHRPDRPSSDVVFNPFSSQDAHILMQLKRTVEIISARGDQKKLNAASSSSRQKQNQKVPGRCRGTQTKNKRQKKATLHYPSRGRIKTLLDGALRAGKAARNERIVPEIATLKCSDHDNATSQMVPSIAVKEVVIERVIEPAVQSSIARLTAMENGTSTQISRMRQQIHGIVDVLG